MKLRTGDSREKLKELEDNSIDALVTDPPYLINFMGKDWDKENSPAGDVGFWEEVLRVMKPGAHGLVFGHSRQHHRVMNALEDAGFEIRDCLMWLYGSGFPKSHNIGKAVDKLQGNSDWEGWGTALKPAYEPIILVRKPLENKLTVAKNVLKHGTGGLNIDASRIGTGTGRFPANVLLDEVSAKILDEQAPKTGQIHGTTGKEPSASKTNAIYNDYSMVEGKPSTPRDNLGGASRFFYCAKVGKKERNAGLDDFEEKEVCYGYKTDSEAVKNRDKKGDIGLNKVKIRKNTHPTVKPIKLMTYLAKLITPPNGKVLDPFMGSGSTGMACALEGFDFVGIDMDPDYVEISKARIEWARAQKEND